MEVMKQLYVQNRLQDICAMLISLLLVRSLFLANRKLFFILLPFLIPRNQINCQFIIPIKLAFYEG